MAQYRFNPDSESVKMRYALLIGQIELSGLPKEQFEPSLWKNGMEWGFGDYSYEITAVQNMTLVEHPNCVLWIGIVFDRDDVCNCMHYAAESIEEVFQPMLSHFLNEIEDYKENCQEHHDYEENIRRLDADDARNDVMYPDTDLFLIS